MGRSWGVPIHPHGRQMRGAPNAGRRGRTGGGRRSESILRRDHHCHRHVRFVRSTSAGNVVESALRGWIWYESHSRGHRDLHLHRHRHLHRSSLRRSSWSGLFFLRRLVAPEVLCVTAASVLFGRGGWLLVSRNCWRCYPRNRAVLLVVCHHLSELSLCDMLRISRKVKCGSIFILPAVPLLLRPFGVSVFFFKPLALHKIPQRSQLGLQIRVLVMPGQRLPQTLRGGGGGWRFGSLGVSLTEHKIPIPHGTLIRGDSGKWVWWHWMNKCTEWLSVWVGFGHLFLFFFCKIHPDGFVRRTGCINADTDFCDNLGFFLYLGCRCGIILCARRLHEWRWGYRRWRQKSGCGHLRRLTPS
mmetsp:Transcript_53670/g.88432  ORF Transcript_53670/g.88432 Transcript_53670/m.88432 type:complete len:357 (+) Transcript_53670:1473-2543(+)